MKRPLNYHIFFAFLIATVFHIDVFAQSYEYMPFRKGENWVIVNMDGEQVSKRKIRHKIFPAFTDIIRFKDGDYWGYMDVQGKIVLPAIYEEAHDFGIDPPIARVKLDDRWQLIEKNGELTKRKIQAGCGGSIMINQNKYNHLFTTNYMGQKGLYIQGKEVVEPRYKKITYPGLAEIFIVTDHRKKSGIVNIHGEVLQDCIYDTIKFVGNTGENRKCYYLLSANGKQGVLSKSGKIIVPCVYDEIREHDIHQLCFVAYEGDKKLGYIYKGKEYWED